MSKYSYIALSNKQIVRLFTIEERPCPEDHNHYDLEFYFPGKGLFKSDSSLQSLLAPCKVNDYKKVDGPHISLHYHPNKPTVFIKRTADYNHYCEVDGVKNKNLFAPILIKVFGKTDIDEYIALQKHFNRRKDIPIQYNPDNDTLVGFFLASKKDVEFKKDIEYPANYF